MAKQFLDSNKVKCMVNLDDNRLGIYFTEPGKNNNLTKIFYDRKNSSFAKYGLKDHLIDKILFDKSFLVDVIEKSTKIIGNIFSKADFMKFINIIVRMTISHTTRIN